MREERGGRRRGEGKGREKRGRREGGEREEGGGRRWEKEEGQQKEGMAERGEERGGGRLFKCVKLGYPCCIPTKP